MEKKIKTIIRQVGDIGEKLSQLLSEEALPAIEKDIILRDIRLLYEAVKDLEDSSPGIPSGEMEKVAETEPEPIPSEAEPVEEKNSF